ncbi:sulfate adenylyltransferase subunit CysN [Hahella sp. SMD15-11]|uniref:Sulfate adenylyltransferase subunit 1 n=1 Tax=Thermohahella caldifontis TaxID=3142973 RepID=A0AB39UXF1_9GAMM
MSHDATLARTDIQEYLKQHENKEMLRLLTCGSVDDGKSTLIGRLLHDSKMIYEDQLEAIRKDSASRGAAGGKIDFSLLVDGLAAEREQGITIDVAYRYFSTSERKFIIADTPGHEQYTRNMATGASTAQLAIILVDARHGVLRQTKRHTFIASLLGIRHIVVAINKMDLVDYSEARYNEIRDDYLAFARSLNVKDLRFVPISALEGDNVVTLSENMPWYAGQPLMTILNTVEISSDRNFSDFRLPVQYVNRPNLDFRGYCGTIASGVIRKGDRVMVLPSRQQSTVKSIVTFDGELEEAFADQAITLTLTDEIDISRGEMLVKPDNVPLVSNRIRAHVVWMTDTPLTEGRQYYIKHTTTLSSATVTRLDERIDINTLEREKTDRLDMNDIGIVELTVNQPLAFDPYNRNRTTGAFILIDRLTNVTIGAGMIIEAAPELSTTASEPVSTAERRARHGHDSAVVRVSGTWAETAGQTLERFLFERGVEALYAPEVSAEALNLLLAAGLVVITQSQVENPIADVTAESEDSVMKAVETATGILRHQQIL